MKPICEVFKTNKTFIVTTPDGETLEVVNVKVIETLCEVQFWSMICINF